MKLVLVEGFPGSGKSTTAQWLALEWQRQGRPARWIYEQQRLVYFLTPDPESAYCAISARRGPEWTQAALPRYESTEFFRRRGLRGFDGLLAYWREHNALCDRAVAALDSIDKLVVDPRRGDWPWRRREIAEFVGLRPVDAPAPAPASLRRFVGRHRVQWRGEARECSVELEDGQLLLDGLLWPRNRLLWKERNVFHAEAWPYEVVFEEGPDGAIQGLSLRA